MTIPGLQEMYWGNTVGEYLQAAGTFVVVWLVFVLLQRFAIDRLRAFAQKTDTDIDDFAVDVLSTIRSPEVYLLAFYIASRPLTLPVKLEHAFRDIVIIAVTYRVLRICERFAAYFVGKAVSARGGVMTVAEKNTQRNITYLVNAVLWAVAILFALNNLGFHVESIIAGLGVTGVAVALAAQAVLGDLFAAVAIFMDKPFVVGDAIALDKDWQGVVEQIGLKTTRVRAPSGELLILPNSALTTSKLRNYRHLTERRVSFRFGVARETPQDKIVSIKNAVGDIVKRTPQVRLDHVNFVGIEASALDFEVVYYVLDADYNRAVEINEAFMLAALDALRKEGVSLAYPVVLAAPTTA